MIQTFRCAETKKIFERQIVRRFSTEIQKVALRKILLLHGAVDLNDLRIPPGNRLEILKGDRKNLYSIRVNDQWRLCFVWKDGNAFEVEVVDYH